MTPLFDYFKRMGIYKPFNEITELQSTLDKIIIPEKVKDNAIKSS
jgi:hypothetical protein